MPLPPESIPCSQCHMDVGTRETQGARAINFSKIRQFAPFHVTLLPSLKALKMQKPLAKYTRPAISEDLSFKISRGKHSPGPLSYLHLGTGSGVVA